MRHIIDPDQLEVGKRYWLREKQGGWLHLDRLQNQRYGGPCPPFFTRFWVWAHAENNQAMERWDIFGPVDESFQMPDFDGLIAQAAAELNLYKKEPHLAGLPAAERAAKGMMLLLPYYNSPQFQVGAEHDVIYMYPTDRALDFDSYNQLLTMGWTQENNGPYDVNEGWKLHV